MAMRQPRQASLSQAALDYAAGGHTILPLYAVNHDGSCDCTQGPHCPTPGKHARLTNWQHAGQGSTSDVDQAAAWWKQWPNANIGILTTSLVVIDCDNEDAARRLTKLLGTHPAGTGTLTCRTARGFHLYYADPQSLYKPSAGRGPDKGLDVRAGASYLVAPPSRHPTGHTYAWINPEAPILEPPPAIKRLLEERATTRTATPSSTARIGEGGRNDTLAHYGIRLRQLGLDEPELRAALRRINTNRCDPPLDDREVDRIAWSTSRYPAGNELVPHAAPHDQTANEPTPHDDQHPVGSTWTPINLLEHELAPPEPPTIANSIYPGKRHILSGEPESGKSWIALHYTHTQLQQGHHAAYIDHEMGPSMTLERLRVLGATPAEIARLLYIDPSEAIHHDTTNAWLDEHNPTLIIIDATIGSLGQHSLDPNSGIEIEAWYQRVVDPLRSRGAAIIVLDHVPKDKENRGKYAIGSERKTGAADVHLSCETIQPFGRGRRGQARVTVRKDRPGHLQRPSLATFTLDTTGPVTSHQYEMAPRHQQDDSGHVRPTYLMQRVSEHLEHNGPSSKNTIEQAVGGRAEFTRRAIDTLIAEGYATRTTRQARGGGDEISLIRPYTEASETTGN